MGNPYNVLGITYYDSYEEARSKYRALCKRYHPDIAGYEATEKFKEIQIAWDSIKDSFGSISNEPMWLHRTLFSIYEGTV